MNQDSGDKLGRGAPLLAYIPHALAFALPSVWPTLPNPSWLTPRLLGLDINVPSSVITSVCRLVWCLTSPTSPEALQEQGYAGSVVTESIAPSTVSGI